uniref:Tc1-like transposase DDE domain-containing protein n=1 Tax=Gouania willdenowi TaxID=441366 RepID=A0A8C5EQQ3_GOUWI
RCLFSLLRSSFKLFACLGHDQESNRRKNTSKSLLKTAKTFLEERHIGSMSWPANSPDLNPTENLWWKLKKMAHDKAPSCKADLATAIRESWNRIDEGYCLSLVKFMPQRPQAVIKTRGGALKYKWCVVVFFFFFLSICFS